MPLLVSVERMQTITLHVLFVSLVSRPNPTLKKKVLPQLFLFENKLNVLDIAYYSVLPT